MFYIQHGYGKSTKIEDVANGGHVDGVILSPAHEDVSQLTDTVQRCRDLGLRVLLDPQSFVYSTKPQGEMRNHPKHDLDFTDMHWAMSAGKLVEQIDAVKLANLNVGVATPLIAPGPFHLNLTDYWMPTAIQYARTAIDQWDDTEIIASVVIDESVLNDWDRVSDWLDVLTTLEVAGFYLVVSRRTQQNPPAPWDAIALTNLLRVVHTLAVVNQYEVIWGYADIDGLLGIAAGATAIASGWSYGLRQFSIHRYTEQRSGGAPAVPRILLPALWSDLRFNEAEDLFNTQFGRALFPPDLEATYESREFGSLGNPEAQGQHLSALALSVSRIASLADLSDRLDLVSSEIDDAIGHFRDIAAEGLTLDARYVNRLRVYRQSLDSFRQAVNL